MKKTGKILIAMCLALWASALSAQTSHWTVNPNDFEYDMTIYFTLAHGEDAVTSEELKTYEVAAFVGNECRGVGEVLTATEDAEGNPLAAPVTYGYLRVYSNATSGESLSFKYYKDGVEKPLTGQTIAFTNGGLTGMPSTPKAFNLDVAYTLGDVNGDGKVNTQDVRLIINRRFNRTMPENYIEAACDMNGDGKINTQDVRLVINLRFNR